MIFALSKGILGGSAPRPPELPPVKPMPDEYAPDTQAAARRKMGRRGGGGRDSTILDAAGGGDYSRDTMGGR